MAASKCLTKAQTVKGEAGLRMQQQRRGLDRDPSLCNQALEEKPQPYLWFSLTDAHFAALTSLSNLSPDLASPGVSSPGSMNTKPFLQYDSDSNKVKLWVSWGRR